MHAHAVQIVKTCEAFAKLGHDVTLFAVRGDANPETTYARYGVEQRFRIEMPAGHLRYFKKPRFVSWLMRSPRFQQADVYFGRDIASLVAATRLGKPVIYEAHAIPRPGTRRWRMLERLFSSPNFSHLVCVTSTLAKAHLEQFPALATKPVLIIPNAAADWPDSTPLANWAGRPNAVQVGFVGRPYPGKGIELMVSAARALHAIDFHIVGAGPADLDWIDGMMPSNIHFHGYQPHGQLGAFIRRFDIAAAPYGAAVLNASGVESASITCPLKLLEYMAAGLPAVVSDLPGVRDILNGDDVATIVPAGDVDALISALTSLAGDPALRSRLGSAARQRFLKRLTLEARARRVLVPAMAGIA
jgi:glycosyltransferase involved in cell wall biosynthesis